MPAISHALCFSMSNSFYLALDSGMLDLEHVLNDVIVRVLIHLEDNLEMNAYEALADTDSIYYHLPLRLQETCFQRFNNTLACMYLTLCKNRLDNTMHFSTVR